MATLCVLLLAPCLAFAGAWPRGAGNLFASSGAQLTWPKGRSFEYPDVYGSGYAEFGLGPRLTAGLDLGSSDATRPEALKAVAFMRYSLSSAGARHQFAVDFGGGKDRGAAVVRAGLSYGTGFEVGGRSGWATLDWHMLHHPAAHRQSHSLDATLGLSWPRAKIIAQLSGYKAPNGAVFSSFTPSYVRQIGKGRHVEIGVVIGLSGKPDPALKLGVWQEF